MSLPIQFDSDVLADLHVHSRFSRATSPGGDLAAHAVSARMKGVGIVGTGDLLHPEWLRELRANLVEVANGFFEPVPERVREMERVFRERLPEVDMARFPKPRFVLQTEVCTVFRSGGKGRRVHHVVLASGWGGAERIGDRLKRYGAMGSDGRPMLKLSARDLVAEVLEADPGAMLIPAHIWTPWYSMLGDRSGFDSVEECYGDLAQNIWAMETGLSADPAMMDRVSFLDRFQVVSCSDAHSPEMIGREATVFRGVLDFLGLREALRTGKGLIGTLEYFPEAGKYHADGHRRCGICWMPEETVRKGGRCPTCGRAVTRGVLSRVEALADRPPTSESERRHFLRLVPLRTVLAQLLGFSERSRKVMDLYWRVVERAGPELRILAEEGGAGTWLDGVVPGLVEALERIRRGVVRIEPGYDGEYGRILIGE